MTPLIDGDILRYEVGFAAETGWRVITEGKETIPPFDYIQNMFHERLSTIENTVGATSPSRIFLTKGKSFRDEIAVTKPYKGTRKDNKPWHYNNLSVYMRDVLGAEVVTGIEADDALSIEHTKDPDGTILCSRDKDLRQVPGWFYSWELGRQPEFGPEYISNPGTLALINNKIKATGLLSFYAQLLTGDAVDNIPGLYGCGPKKTYSVLTGGVGMGHISDDPLWWIQHHYNNDDYLLEQGQLLWMTRRLNEDGSPQLWEIGMEE